MSMAALRWVRPLKMTPTQKLVLWALADQANEDGEAWPSIAGLEQATCLSDRAIQKALRELAAMGALTIERGGGRHRTALYRLSLEDVETPNVVRGIATEETPNVSANTPNVSAETPNVVPKTPNHVHPNPQEPSLTLILPNKRARAKNDEPVTVPDWLPPDAWQAWCDYRRGKRWTADAARLSIRNLGKLRDEGNDPRAVIEQSIANGWTGLFPDKQRRAAPAERAGKLDWLWRDMEREAATEAESLFPEPRRLIQ